MKKFVLNRENAHDFARELQGKIDAHKSIVFPGKGHKKVTKQFRSLRKETRENPIMLTTHKVSVVVEKNGIAITSPLNKGYAYSELLIPFTGITVALGSYFWKDRDGYWRQMTFSTKAGWALILSEGRMKPYDPKTMQARTPIRSNFSAKQKQFLTGTGDW